MTNARHAGITPFVLNEINKHRGVIAIIQPSGLSLKSALNELSRHYPAAETPIIARQRPTDRCVTPYVFGRTLLSAAYDLQVTPNDALVVGQMRTFVSKHGLPIHPDSLLGLWKDEVSVSRASARTYAFSPEQVTLINTLFGQLDAAEEQSFQANGTVSMTGLLSIPSAMALEGPETIIAVNTAQSPMSTRARIMLTHAARRRLLILTDTPDLPDWTVQFDPAGA